MEEIVKISEPQKRVLTSEKPITCLIGGTGCGKTFVGSWWALKNLSYGDGMIITPSYPMLIRSTLPSFLSKIKNTTLEGEYFEQKKMYVSKNGKVVYFGSADNPLSLDGPHLDWIWIDEASLTSITTFEVALSRIGAKNGKLLITTTPNLIKTKNWIYTELYENRNQDYLEYIHSISIDNPTYSKEKFEFLKRILDERTFSIRHLGEFIRSSALVYGEILDLIFIEPFEIDDTWIKYVAIDPGIFYGVLFIAKKEDKIVVYNEYLSSGEKVLTSEDLAKIILSKEKNIKAIIYDPSRVLDVANLRKDLKNMGYDIPFYPPTEKEVLIGIQEVIKTAKEGNLKVFNNLKFIKDEFESYHRPVDENGVIIDEEPVKEDDHLLDCLRYFVVFAKKKSIVASTYIQSERRELKGTTALRNFIEERRKRYGR